MKLALHSSITFWSGILVMAFIGWAWYNSMHHRFWCGRQDLSFDHAGGGVAFGYFPNSNGVIEKPPQLKRSLRQFNASKVASFPTWVEPFFLRGINKNQGYDPERPPGSYRDYFKSWIDYMAPEDWLIFIPHWLILLAVAVPWTALLLWRARRRKRAIGKNLKLAHS